MTEEETLQIQQEEPNELKREVSKEEGFGEFAANNKRLYINNVSYKATEDDLLDLLKGFGALSVLIPSQTVRGFKVIQQKSLGIAYVDFDTEEDAEKAKADINGKLLHDRPLRVKNFVPYQPKVQVKDFKGSRRHSLFHRKSHKEDTDKETSETVEEKKSNDEQVKSAKAVDQTEKEEIHESAVANQPVSKDTIFIGHLSPKVTDGDLRRFFYDYGATEVYIFKSRLPKTKPLFARHRLVSALVTLKDAEDLTKVIEDLTDKKLNGKRVLLKAAHLSKIEEVKRAAEARQKKLEQTGQEAKGAASAALSASTDTPDSLDKPTIDEEEHSLNVVRNDDDEVDLQAQNE